MEGDEVVGANLSPVDLYGERRGRGEQERMAGSRQMGLQAQRRKERVDSLQ